jgi:hypothetical protein
VRVAPEAFLYPHGLAVVINLVVDGRFTPEAAAALAINLRRDPAFKAEGKQRPMGGRRPRASRAAAHVVW